MITADNVSEAERKEVCKFVSETLGFGCQYADKRSGGKRRYKWIFKDRLTNSNLKKKVDRLTKEISDTFGLCDLDISDLSFINGPDYKIDYGWNTPNNKYVGVKYQYIAITI